VRLEIALVGELRPERVLESPGSFSKTDFDVAELEAEDRLDVRVGPLGRRAFLSTRFCVFPALDPDVT